MARRGPKGHDEENREPRNRAMSVYLSEDEHERIERMAKGLGFKSKSELAAYVLGHAIKGGFSGWTFTKLGYNFAKLIGKAEPDTIEIPMPRFWRKEKEADEKGKHE